MSEHDELLARLDNTSERFINNQLAKDAAAAIRSLQAQLDAECKANDLIAQERDAFEDGMKRERKAREEAAPTDEQGRPMTYWGGLKESAAPQDDIYDPSNPRWDKYDAAATVEAVAWMWEHVSNTSGEVIRHGASLIKVEGTDDALWNKEISTRVTPLYPESALAAAKVEGLEEAAKICDTLLNTNVDGTERDGINQCRIESTYAKAIRAEIERRQK